ncbi:DUF1992 domain-containing protein [Nocardia otitidiscaviarum]|uniref:DUF1992 domain-containing protein n=1 Tax=Nocardia otitidiscaviarum TaxID=1823 RepID=A0A516NHP8_9NOCA|nr:DUF1992 domain-containing protein [Nocardia otitidiscaviarum]MCP9620093.1 DUF1992 domain-containing protein [Nocardia otitidiscaviarum]QDP78410.1 DUF1992 domain-containing protein [Nocardia otitidiscaviarum]
MVERKPAGMGFESWIDRQIREATERGEFDDLEGAGKPIPGEGTPVDENWWLHGYLKREGVSGDALLPPALLLRRDIERIDESVRDANSEAQVRETVGELNRRIVEWLRMPVGPAVPIRPVDADEVVARWRSDRVTATETAIGAVRADSDEPGRDRTDAPTRWWHRLWGGRRH